MALVGVGDGNMHEDWGVAVLEAALKPHLRTAEPFTKQPLPKRPFTKRAAEPFKT